MINFIWETLKLILSQNRWSCFVRRGKGWCDFVGQRAIHCCPGNFLKCRCPAQMNNEKLSQISLLDFWLCRDSRAWEKIFESGPLAYCYIFFSFFYLLFFFSLLSIFLNVSFFLSLSLIFSLSFYLVLRLFLFSISLVFSVFLSLTLASASFLFLVELPELIMLYLRYTTSCLRQLQ